MEKGRRRRRPTTEPRTWVQSAASSGSRGRCPGGRAGSRATSPPGRLCSAQWRSGCPLSGRPAPRGTPACCRTTLWPSGSAGAKVRLCLDTCRLNYNTTSTWLQQLFAPAACCLSGLSGKTTVAVLQAGHLQDTMLNQRKKHNKKQSPTYTYAPINPHVHIEVLWILLIKSSRRSWINELQQQSWEQYQSLIIWSIKTNLILHMTAVCHARF